MNSSNSENNHFTSKQWFKKQLKTPVFIIIMIQISHNKLYNLIKNEKWKIKCINNVVFLVEFKFL